MSSDAPLLLIVSSPSGAGKTTLTNRLLALVPGLVFSVSHTTRKPRAGEQNGREYHFINRDEFELMIDSGQFLEWAQVHGNLYGTARSEIDRAQGARGVIFDVDHQGARQIKSADPGAVAVFILPPNMHVLLERLRGRKSDDEATVMRRYGVAREEIQHYGLFDYLLVNEDLESACEALMAIFRAEECRRRRLAPVAERLLAEGRRFDVSMPPEPDASGHKARPR
jgi:guanylate kinase